MNFKDRIYPLTCKHCGTLFDAKNYRQHYRHIKYGRPAYCSGICKKACMPKPPMCGPARQVFTGPCKHCGKEYASKTSKQFCSLKCYTSSDQMRKRLLVMQPAGSAASAKIITSKTGRECRTCPQCLNEFEIIKSSKRKYCGRLCMRIWLAARFDRWIASPEGIALPQNYDEFLSASNLPCLIEGCNWRGDHLSVHMNTAHGVKASELKRAAGFNLGSGIISSGLQIRLAARAKTGVAITPIIGKPKGGPSGYASLEGKEHKAKARALALVDVGPIRVCAGCNNEFQQTTPFGRAKYCTISCRDIHAPYTRKIHNKSAKESALAG